MNRLYLDANGSSAALAAAKDKINSVLDVCGNPSSFHENGRAVRMLIDEARVSVADAVLARAKDVIFTSGASEANRLFVDALIKKSRKLSIPLKVVMSPLEHPSLLKPVMEAHHLGHISLSIMALNPDGNLVVAPDELISCDVLIVCQAHNETGIMPDLLAILPFIRPETLVMCDMSQGFARVLPPLARVDVLTFSAQKMGGFAGAGGLVLRGNGKTLPPPWLGGGQERGFRPGTESLLLIAACGEAAKYVKESRACHEVQALWRDNFERELAQVAPIKIVGKGAVRLPNTSAISFYKEDPDALRIACDLYGLSVGFGAACSGLAPEGSFALKRLSLTQAEEKTCVRFSFGPHTTEEEVQEALRRLKGRILSVKT